jgi:pyruvate dehydrogenase E1 component alpha subunit
MREKKNGAGDGKQEFSLISNETLLELYRGLLKARMPGRDGGWEFDAAAVAVAKDLCAGDAVIADGAAKALRMMPVNGRRPSGDAQAFARELERAVGSALVQKTRKNGKVTVVFGGAKHGQAWSNALETARVHRLPMVFAAELQEELLPARRSAKKTNGTGLEPGTEMARITVDGHDVVGSYRVAHEAIERARKDRGPTLIECTAFRIAGQRRQDSIAAMEQYLRLKGLLERGTKRDMLKAVARESKTRKR